VPKQGAGSSPYACKAGQQRVCCCVLADHTDEQHGRLLLPGALQEVMGGFSNISAHAPCQLHHMAWHRTATLQIICCWVGLQDAGTDTGGTASESWQ
jgi:hypothetical protein